MQGGCYGMQGDRDSSLDYFHFLLALCCSTTYVVFGTMYFKSLLVISQFTVFYQRFNLI